jgi:hypothetical protein
MSEKIWQEFYCNDCLGYIRLRLNVALSMNILVCCPGRDSRGNKCTRKHPRNIKDGKIVGDSHVENAEEIIPPPSAYSKTPWTKIPVDARAATEIKESDIPPRDPALDAILRESWSDRFMGKV